MKEMLVIIRNKWLNYIEEIPSNLDYEDNVQRKDKYDEKISDKN